MAQHFHYIYDDEVREGASRHWLSERSCSDGGSRALGRTVYMESIKSVVSTICFNSRLLTFFAMGVPIDRAAVEAFSKAFAKHRRLKKATRSKRGLLGWRPECAGLSRASLTCAHGEV